jgi:hypothetical protein
MGLCQQLSSCSSQGALHVCKVFVQLTAKHASWKEANVVQHLIREEETDLL